MNRLLAALFALVMIGPALVHAQNPGATWEERRDRARERREERRDERRQRIERMRDGIHADGVHLRVLKSYTLAEGETASEPVVVLGGSAQIDGHAEEDVVVIGGSLRLGPKAVVDGNVVSVGGGITMETGATVKGRVDETAVPWPSIGFGSDWDASGWWRTASVVLSIVRLGFVLAVAVLLTLVAPGWIATIARRPALSSGVAGLVAEVLSVPALILLIVVLAVSIVGIPLLAGIPVLLAGLGLLWAAGFTGVAARLGRALRGSSGAANVSVLDVLLGYTVIVSVTVLAQVLVVGLGWLGPVAWPLRSAGWLIEYVAWTIGLGAALTSLFAERRGVVPPPFPV